MKKATITALKKSIETWKRRAAGEDVSPTPASCALCERFNPPSFNGCVRAGGEKCPIYSQTGRIECRGTPYRPFASYRGGIIHIEKSVRLKKLAQDEVDFLESLLPAAPQPTPKA